jgi:hypothetical protein
MQWVLEHAGMSQGDSQTGSPRRRTHRKTKKPPCACNGGSFGGAPLGGGALRND